MNLRELLKQFKYWRSAKSSGLLELPHDERDWHWRDLFGKHKPQATIRKLAPFWQKNQRGRSNCSFQAGANVMGEYFGEEVSARWLTAKAFQQGLCQKDGWADLRAVMKVAQRWGVVFEKDLTSDENASWDWYRDIDFHNLDKLAEKNKIPSYVKIDTVSEYFEAIDSDRPVLLGREWRTSMNTGGGFSAPWIITQAIRKLGWSVSGHATLGCGYDLKKDATIELNSYGDQWGDKGLFYCSLEDLQSDIDRYGAYALTDIAYTPKDIKINSIRKLLDKMILALKGLMERERFYKIALAAYQREEILSPNEINFGCAIALSVIHNRTFDKKVDFASTSQWHKYLKESDEWEEILRPEPTCVIVYPTSSIPPQSNLSNGHILICGKVKSPDGSYWTMSNNSKTGRWDTHFTVKSANDYYHKNGGIPAFYFRKI